MTDEQKRLSHKYILYQLLTSMWVVGAVWLYFYRIYINDQQVGILDGMAFAIGLVAEVPSGALADKFGRDKIVRLGQVLAGSGLLIQAAGSSFVPFFVGQAVLMIGASLASGADEALFFEKLNFKRTSTEWRKLVTRSSQFARLGSVVALIAGGLLHNINPRIPWVLNGIIFIMAALVIWDVKDTRPRSARQKFLAEVADYFADIKAGFKQFGTPKLWLYMPIIITVQGLFYAAGWGLLRLILLDRFHFSPLLGSIAIASCSLITVGLLALMHKYADRMSEKRVLTTIALSAATSLLVSVPAIGAWGFLVLLVLYAGEHTLYPFMSEALNNHASGEQRATVLSVASFLRMLPYVALAPLIGLLNTRHQLGYFLIGWAIFIGVAIMTYLLLKKRDTRLDINH